MTKLLPLLAIGLAVALSACATRPRTAPPAPAPIVQAPPPTPQPQGEAPRAPSVSLQAALNAAAGDRVYFALDSDAIDDNARATLQRQASWLRERPDVRVRIEGNADERGTREYNLALGARRAAAARMILIAEGVAPPRIATVSYGKERPIDGGTGEAAWARNRNAGTVVIDIAD